MGYSIFTETKKEHLTLMKMLFAVGYVYHRCKTPEEAHESYHSYQFTNLEAGQQLSGSKQRLSQHKTLTSISDLVKVLGEPPPIKVTLNEKYTAEVDKTGVIVGCQKFSLETVEALAEAVKTFKNEKT